VESYFDITTGGFSSFPTNSVGRSKEVIIIRFPFLSGSERERERRKNPENKKEKKNELLYVERAVTWASKNEKEKKKK
jgi:hypothetical protein